MELKKYINISNCTVIPHGIDTKEFTDFSINEKNTTKFKNIAFIGIINTHKGGHYIKELIENNKNPYVIYHLFGSSVIDIKDSANFINHGGYNKSDLPKILNDNKIDLVLLLSTCFESFSYVLSETAYAQVPCLAFDIGAIASRIKKDNIGWVIDRSSSSKDIENKYNEVFDEKEAFKLHERMQSDSFNYNDFLNMQNQMKASTQL